MRIRTYRPSDRTAVEHIQFSTWFLGKSAKEHGLDQKRFDPIIAHYLEEEPESCFVAEENGKVVGYLLGCISDDKSSETLLRHALNAAAKLCTLPFMRAPDRKYWWGRIRGLVNAATGKSGELKLEHPENAGHLHINLLPEARGKGAGSKLMKAYFTYAKSKGAKTIHADSWGSKLNPNRNFWLKNGFTVHSTAKTSFWDAYYPDEDIAVVCYVKRL